MSKVLKGLRLKQLQLRKQVSITTITNYYIFTQITETKRFQIVVKIQSEPVNYKFGNLWIITNENSILLGPQKTTII